MKKIFLSALAVMSLAACMQEAVVETPQGGAIAFENAFVGNATRAAVIDNTNLNAFKVWGYVNSPDGTVFNGNIVSNENGPWEYTGGTQYWAPEKEYTFAAVAPVTMNWELAMETSENAARTLTFENDGNTDLIYAAKKVLASPAGEKTPAVALEFNHLLSKVQLSFTNGFPTNATVALSNIKMETPKNASIDLTAEEPSWTATTTQKFDFSGVTLAATAAQDVEEYFIVPAQAVITFDLAVIVGSETVYEGEKTATLPADAFEMGHAYKLTAVIDAAALDFSEIEFTVDGVNEWVPAGNDSDAAANLLYAAQIGGTYTLTENVVLDKPLAIPAGVELVLDLGGNTIEAALKETGRHHYAIDNYGTLVIEGEGAINARGIENFGVMEINGNITITNVDTNGGAAIWNEGKLTINAGTYRTNDAAGEGSYGAALNTRPGGEAVVNGGTFRAYSQLTYAIINEGKTVINDADAKAKHGAVCGSTTAETVINGGTYALLENPRVSDHCTYYVSAIYGGSFTLGNNTDSGAKVFYESQIAEGYVATEDNGVWTVALDLVETAAEFKSKVANGETNIMLAGNAVIDITDEVVYLTKATNISAPADSKATLKGKFVAESGQITFANIKFAPNAQFSTALPSTYGTYVNGTYSAIVTVHKTAANFENCEFDGGNDYAVSITYFDEEPGLVMNVNNCKFTQTYIYSKVLCNLTNNTFILNDCPYAMCVWPNVAGTTNGKCHFVNNTVSSNYYSAEGKGHSLVQLLTQSTPYAKTEFNVQGNTTDSTKYIYGWVNKVTFATDGSVSFAEGSSRFNINPTTGKPE